MHFNNATRLNTIADENVKRDLCERCQFSPDMGPSVFGLRDEGQEAGNVWEHQTGRALARNFNGTVHWERDDPALRVRNGVWSGHIDILIEGCADFPAGAIIIPTYLYYRSWSNWAELQVWGYDDGIEWEGEINGKHGSGEFDIRLGDKIEELHTLDQSISRSPAVAADC
jgi:hypothetical protein